MPPHWQPDSEASRCALCNSQFSILNRRHHCRHCGRVVCSPCSTHFITYLPTTYVVSPPGRSYLESPLVPHRTCDECNHELEVIKSLNTQGSIVQEPCDIQEELSRCPICDLLLVHMQEAQQEAHINSCLVSCSPTSRNRMIVYKLSEKAMGECPICFEDFEGGQSVGRLECLCIFHDECILRWFKKKGAGKCPVHNVHG